MINIGISSCLLGNEVRYDSESNKDKYIIQTLSQYFKFHTICPENDIWGNPRETIRLVQLEDQTIQVQTTYKKEDKTQQLLNSCIKSVDIVVQKDLSGFILKSSSPTCGLERVKVYKTTNAPSEKKGVGIFANVLKQKYPYLPIEEEGRLNDPWLRENFLMQVFAYQALKDLVSSNPQLKDLVIFHTNYKYLIMSKSQKYYKSLGNIVANHENKSITEILNDYKKDFLKCISLKNDISKTYNVLQHIFGYFKKYLTPNEKITLLDTMLEYKERIIPLIAVVKILNLYVQKFDIVYLKNQVFLNPYPKQLALRSEIKAFK